jgi:integrase
LRIADVQVIAGVSFLSITDDGPGRSVKTAAARRLVPVHSELVRLGFLAHVQRRSVSATPDAPLWPAVPLRAGKPGGYFSQWFGCYRRSLGLGTYPDFHCFRHTVRTLLAAANISEPVIDQLVGHEVKGSTGAKVYTHTASAQLRMAIESLHYPGLRLPEADPAGSTCLT